MNKTSVRKPKRDAVYWAWECIGHNPTTWGFGEVKDGVMKPVAMVVREKRGTWLVYFGGVCVGTEPSRHTAMEAAEKFLEANK